MSAASASRARVPALADDNLHPIHRADRRLAEIRAAALRVLLVVAAAPLMASLVSIIILAVRP